MPDQTKVALVTGAGTGIGRATALKLVSAGFTTYASARRLETVADLEAVGCRPLSLDVTDETSRQRAIQTIEQEAGSVDLLVNNAANGKLGAVEEVGLTDWRRQFETNVFGLVGLCQLVLPGMRRKGSGRIINISSMGGEVTFPFAGSYHATKYALEALSDALRLEVRAFGVEVVLIQPAAVKTPLGYAGIDDLQPPAGSPYTATLTRFQTMSRQTFESGRGVLEPEQVARVILKAAQVRRPKARYKVGSTAHLLPFLHRALPNRAWDAMLGRMMKDTAKA